MPRKTLASLGVMVRERRGTRRLREAASEIGIGVATVMRVENGRIPDLGTFAKICKWLGEEPGTFLGFEPRTSAKTKETRSSTEPLFASAHLKVDQAPEPQTVAVLAKMILLAAKRQRGTLEDALTDDV